MNPKIDFVLLWVDGNDSRWQIEKSKYTKDKEDDAGLNRYRDWETLKYWFRGVEKFTPWVNHVFFVTCGQLPNWLNVDHPKLRLISHSDYMEKEYLPTFSSHPIELSLHKIPGLSEHFVYFNDDTFIIKQMLPTDFFRNCLPCAACGFEIINIKYDDVFYDVMVNNMRVINSCFDVREFIIKHFDKLFNWHYDIKQHIKSLLLLPWSMGFIPGFINPHLPNAYLKTTFNEVWEKEADLLDETSKHKFRSRDDVNQYIFQYWQFLQGKFVPINMKKQGQFFYLNQQTALWRQAIVKQKYKMICLNDDFENVTEEEYNRMKNEMSKAFNTILGEKSAYEI